MGKQSLGRGLNSILRDHQMPVIESADGQKVEAAIVKISVDLIDPNPYQPRTSFTEEEINELADSMKEHGILQPITLRKHQGRFQIVAGERRFRAAKKLGWDSIDARVHDLVSDKSMMEWALIENVQRKDLNPVEEARAYQNLLEHHSYTHELLATRMGKSRSAITNSVRLLRLPESVLGWIESGKLSPGHARSLLSPEITDPEKAAMEIMEKGLTVRQTETIARNNASSPNKKNTNNTIDPNTEQLVKDIQYALGTRVRLALKGAGGILHVEFDSVEDLNRIHGAIAK